MAPDQETLQVSFMRGISLSFYFKVVLNVYLGCMVNISFNLSVSLYLFVNLPVSISAVEALEHIED